MPGMMVSPAPRSAPERTIATASKSWNAAVAINQFREGDKITTPLQFKPSDVGLPAYMDQRANELGQTILPLMTIDGYATVGRGGVPVFTRYRVMTARGEMTHIRGSHTIRAAFDTRNQFRTGGGGGNTSGNFTFNNTYTRRNDDTFTPVATLGHSMAAYLMGLPSGISTANNDTFATHTPYYAWFVQDSWRATSRLTLNIGLRVEYEMGATERYNRMLGSFDPSIEVPIAQAVQAAYARSPIPELAASSLQIRGASCYTGGDRGRRLYRNELMWLPRFGAGYQVNEKTVVRAGYGIFFDTINVLNFGPDQFCLLYTSDAADE